MDRPLLAGEDLLDSDGKTLKGDALGNTTPTLTRLPTRQPGSRKMMRTFCSSAGRQPRQQLHVGLQRGRKQLSRVLSRAQAVNPPAMHADERNQQLDHIMSNFQHALAAGAASTPTSRPAGSADPRPTTRRQVRLRRGLHHEKPRARPDEELSAKWRQQPHKKAAMQGGFLR